MSRRRRANKNPHKPDSRYNSPLVSQLINVVMKNGKKTVAQRIVYGAIERVSEKLEKGDPMELLLGALENCRPKLEVKSRRVGGATYQVPVEISHDRQTSMAFRWLVNAAAGRKGQPMVESLAAEFIDAYNNTGTVVKKREETHKMAQANRAFAHLRWGNN
ncbi:MAG TPA: 30S ribosomal protein S7 [Candidatus Spyradosoma merdigallinarum]|uniref:Small ribosomal subunit protein uS7 n=1 Tax=Candidatus Spyradosoma merdigallinarum TaxID=2840950 RepID=A0A9D1NIZ6_9BACT|nr:30S ribosomal protein S7 [Candidatus Spyradosoma merdigallinarum]